MNEELIRRARKIKIILTDIDGIWTDGKINYFVNSAGKIEEFKSFHALDGLGVLLLGSVGLICGVITGRRHPTTEARCRNLGVKYLFQGFLSKTGPLHEIMQLEGVTPEEVAYIGDDLSDLPLLETVGLSATVPNAEEAVKKSVHFITQREGGNGAFRDLANLVLQAQGKAEILTNAIGKSEWKKGPQAQLQVVTSQEGIN